MSTIVVILSSRLTICNTLSRIFIALAYRNNSPWIDMSPHTDILFRFRTNQSLLLLLNAAFEIFVNYIKIIGKLLI
jgi:hypothetical protein